MSNSLEEDLQVILEHYGTKGMKWGVRKDHSGPASASTGFSKKGKATITTTKGSHQQAHPDAIKAQVIRRTVKKSGTHAISNDDLKTLQARLNLEHQVKNLTASPGKAYVSNLLKQNGNQLVGAAVNESLHSTIRDTIKEAKRGKGNPTLF